VTNDCHFSPCRRYRYTLEHMIDPLLGRDGQRRIMWIGLNPSTADESQLDPTLRRIRAFSVGWGFTSFVMTNLFAFRATDPADMLAEADPVGPENDDWLVHTAAGCEKVVACWGTHGAHVGREVAVMRLLNVERLTCLGLNQGRSPKHPLYVSARTALVPFRLG
jgi:hypothetical protein